MRFFSKYEQIEMKQEDFSDPLFLTLPSKVDVVWNDTLATSSEGL